MGSRSGGGPASSVRVRAFAKVNLTLRVFGLRPDGYHELRTVFQSIALHDTLTFAPASGPLRIECDVADCPDNRDNIVWRAAQAMWRAAGRRGVPRGLHVRIRKRIPLQAGLGGGSSNAAAALRALAAMWQVDVGRGELSEIAVAIGADVPFFLTGGTVLGLGRGDLLFPLAEWPARSVVLAMPEFGVSTPQAYRWLDEFRSSRRRRAPAFPRSSRFRATPVFPVAARELVNDLTPPVAAQHREIARLVRRLLLEKASHAEMSGSGSAVFGLFDSRQRAQTAAAAVAGARVRTVVTRMLGRREYERLGRPARLDLDEPRRVR
jgi:4-diphosphocytidyl-2-C-methyl-D-erythritol kinase